MKNDKLQKAISLLEENAVSGEDFNDCLSHEQIKAWLQELQEFRNSEPYVLVREPVDTEIHHNAQIYIVDVSSEIGKNKVKKMLEDGFTCVGSISSDLKLGLLQHGLNFNREQQILQCRAMFDEIAGICQSFRNI